MLLVLQLLMLLLLLLLLAEGSTQQLLLVGIGRIQIHFGQAQGSLDRQLAVRQVVQRLLLVVRLVVLILVVMHQGLAI